MRSIRLLSSNLKLGSALVGLIAGTTTIPVFAQELPPILPAAPQSEANSPHGLLLSVHVNESPTGALAHFQRLTNGKLAATPDDLRKAGFRPDRGKVDRDGLVALDSLPDVSWQYIEAQQKVAFTAPDAARLPATIDLDVGGRPIDLSAVRSDFGLLTNYTLYATTQSDWDEGSNSSTLNGTVESRLLTPFGTVSGNVLGRMNPRGDSYDLARLDTAWRYTDPKNMLNYVVGDTTSGALSWSGSYRLGGLQIRRNFSIRPDLVTSPLPNLSGSASVPSTLDLYLNNMKVFSGDVPAGPFDFTGLPYLGGGGDARIVMKDALGRESVIQRSYFFAPDMLRKGFVDFSAEIGFPRLGYGSNSFDYSHDLAASGSIRYGLNNWMTLEGHAETVRGLINGGAGITTSLGPYGSVSASFAGSEYSGETGGKASVFYQFARYGYSFYVGGDRMIGDYNDVGLVIDRANHFEAPISSRSRQVDRIGISFPLGFDPSSLSIGYSRVRGADDDDNSSIITASWSRTVFDNVSIYASAYVDLDQDKEYGVYAGLSVPLGNDMTASTSVSRNGDRTSFDTSVSKAVRLADGTMGWSLQDHEVIGGEGSRSVNAHYRSRFAELSGSVNQSGSQGRVSASIDGSVVMAGGDVFLANRVDDAFAVIKAGGPNVDVSLNSSRVTKTNSRGRAFVPSLKSYRNNRISIDPSNIPFELQPESTEVNVVPADRSGTVVDFGVKKVDAAIVNLTGPEGKPLPLGSVVALDASTESTVVGYDGRVWLTGLLVRNNISVTLPEAGGTCRASFDYQAQAGSQSEIGPVTCR